MKKIIFVFTMLFPVFLFGQTPIPLKTVLLKGNDGNGLQIKNIANPTLAQDAATKAYVDAAPSSSVTITGGDGIGVGGAFPSFTVTNTAPNQTVSITQGTGISVTGAYPNYSVANTSPATTQTVTLTGRVNAQFLTTTGTYSTTTLSSSGVTPGTYGDATHIPSFTVGSDGTLSLASTNTFVVASVSPSYSLTIAATTTVTGTTSNFSAQAYASSSLTAWTMVYSGIGDGTVLTIDYQKTTTSDCVITFPAGSILSTHSDVSAIVSSTMTLQSTINGRYLIKIRNINSAYHIFIEQEIQ